LSRFPDLTKLQILRYPDPRLREHAGELKETGALVKEMAQRMGELMGEAGGVGLAATQVGWPFRIIVLNTSGEPDKVETYLNPQIVAKEGKSIVEEGCLSLPGLFAKVRRAERVRVRATRADGEVVEFEADGLAARAWQHELDHLEGGLFVDRVGPTAKILLLPRLHSLEKEYELTLPPDEAKKTK